MTAQGDSHIRAAITRTPGRFTINTADAAVGAGWETNHEEVYRFGSNVPVRVSLIDAGPALLHKQIID